VKNGLRDYFHTVAKLKESQAQRNKGLKGEDKEGRRRRKQMGKE
jgi:hypothetical protein